MYVRRGPEKVKATLRACGLTDEDIEAKMYFEAAFEARACCARAAAERPLLASVRSHVTLYGPR